MTARTGNGQAGMRTLRIASVGITTLGVVALLAAAAFDLNDMVVLTGILLLLAGIVKIIVVQLWIHVAGLGTDDHDPIRPV